MRQKSKTMKYFVSFGALLAFLVAPLAFAAFEARPIALTSQATFVTEKSVQLNGRVNPSELPDTYEWFEWGISGRSAVYETKHQQLWGTNMLVNTKATLIGLAPSTQYFYRQVSENGHGKDVGQTVYVTTKPLGTVTEPIALVSTYAATFIGNDSATLRGYLSPHGDSNTKVWFEWGMTDSVSNQTPKQGTWGDSGPVEAKLQGLRPGTIYYFRAVAENKDGRTQSALKIFVTTGSPFVETEAPREQLFPQAGVAGSAVSRTTTTSGATDAPQTDASTLPQALNRPGDFFSMILKGLRGKDNPDTTSSDHASVETQIASVAASSPLPGSEMLTGKKDVEVVVQKIGPTKVIPHTPIEYRIAYAYRRNVSATNAKLKITIPGEVVYIGDNTNNELLLLPGSGSERTYVLPLGKIKNGSTRTMSILGMTTGDAKGFPDAVVELTYVDKEGTHVVGAGTALQSDSGSARENSASVANIREKILPSSLWGWIVYILIVVGAIIGVRQAKIYYVRRRESLIVASEGHDVASYVPPFLPGAV